MDRTSKLLLAIIAFLLVSNLFKSTPAIGYDVSSSIYASGEICYVFENNKLMMVHYDRSFNKLKITDEIELK